MKKTLFLTFDGILEPLGYTQVLGYLIHLSKENNISLLSIEKKKDFEQKIYLKKLKKILLKNNISWDYIIYPNSYIAKYLLILRVIIKVLHILFKNKISIIHARSYISGFVCYILSFFLKFTFIFDIRGFWIDERVEWHLWSKKSLKYKIFKFYENKIYNKSNVIVTLTNDAKKFIIKKNLSNVSENKIFVIPTSVNIKDTTNDIILKKYVKFIHLGAIGSRYNFYKYIELINNITLEKEIKMSIINKGEHTKIKNILNQFNLKNKFELKYIPPYEINNEIFGSDFGVFFPVRGFYLTGYFPTKLGEFLSCGVPVITCKINNHVDSILRDNKIGLIIEDLDNINYQNINMEILSMLNDKNIKKRCTSIAKKYFDIKNASEQYRKIYKDFR